MLYDFFLFTREQRPLRVALTTKKAESAKNDARSKAQKKQTDGKTIDRERERALGAIENKVEIDSISG
jgi:hypothetical protein